MDLAHSSTHTLLSIHSLFQAMERQTSTKTGGEAGQSDEEEEYNGADEGEEEEEEEEEGGEEDTESAPSSSVASVTPRQGSKTTATASTSEILRQLK